MKYKYSKVVYFLQILLGVLILIPFMIFINKTFMDSDSNEFLELIIGVSIGLIVIVISGSKIWLNKYIELRSRYIHFHAYRNGASVDNYDVKYENIVSIQENIIPIVGINRITILLKNGDSFEISRSFSNFEEMCCNLIGILKKSNSDAVVSESLQKQLSKKHFSNPYND